MSELVTVSELRVVLSDVPTGEAVDAALQLLLDAAEASCLRQLIGVTIEAPAPNDLKQVIRELASSYWLTKGSGGRIAVQSIDGSGVFEYMANLTSEQKATLRQIRVEHGAVAI